MSGVAMLQVAAVLLALAVAGGLLLHSHNARMDRLAARCRAVGDRRTRSVKGAAKRSGPRLGQVVAAVGSRVISTGLLSSKTLKTLRATLESAGLRPDSALGLFVGSKLLLMVGLTGAGYLIASRVGLSGLRLDAALGGSLVVGMLLPDMVIKRTRSRHLERVERGLPDALDLLIICTEAGIAVEPALLRVGQELMFAHPATAAELAATSNELQLTGDPAVAFANMGRRTTLESLRRLGATIVQTLEYGTPLAQALRFLATELRGEMITRFEEKAARLPVMLTIPMIVFILPALFFVIAGPAAIQVYTIMHR